MPGPRWAYAYKWANIMALTQFQKYDKRGYDVKVRAASSLELQFDRAWRVFGFPA